MSQTVRFRRARSFEHLESYAFLAGWPFCFTLPYGLWTWAIAFAPDLVVVVLRWMWRARSPIVAEARRTGSGVELLDDGGRKIEGFEDSEVDAVTSFVDTKRRTIDLRVDRKGKKLALVFEVSGDDDIAAVAKRLGVDLERARSRYVASSLAARPLALPFVIGMMVMLYSIFGSHSADGAFALVWFNRLVFLPIVVLLSVPTTLDVGRDGVAWRWLFIRRYVAFSSLVSMQLRPPNARTPKILGMHVQVRNGRALDIPIGKKAQDAVAHLVEAFAASGKVPPPSAVIDEWLPRSGDEPVSAWIQRLRAKSAAGGSYRGTDIRHLWPLAEDPSTPQELRCAMLLVLATNDEARERVRTLATHVVDPDVHAVLEGIADGANDAQLALMLERVAQS